ncbi:MAG TPA: ribosomal protein S18-alanine N-acetyltransferase [Rhodocyclaceae bacterium]
MDYRAMAETDLDAVAAAEQRIYPFPWTRGNFADSLRAGDAAWLGEEGGALSAYGVVTVTLDEAQLLNISVLPELQGQGRGRRMLAHLMDDARSRGATRMFLEVRPTNASGRALYQGVGFTLVGQRRDYYPAVGGGREDALVMALDL